MSTKVTYGWAIQDQAAVIQGMSFGPGWLRGKQRTGPVQAGHAHNLIGKDIVFHGDGKGALGAIVEQMKAMPRVKVRCGIYPGMMIEKWEESEFGGGMDEVRVVATDKDISRVPYYLYAFEEEKSDYAFSSLVTSFVSRATGFVPSSGWGGLARDTLEALATFGSQVASMAPEKAALKKALGAKRVIVLLTSKLQHSRQPIATHRHTHTMPTLAQDIVKAVMALT